MRQSDAKLAEALREIGLLEMADRAERSFYNDYFSPMDLPIMALAAELAMAGTSGALALRARVIAGEFDATKDESDEWSKSSEGQDTFRRLMGREHDE
jgi:hypothetical protein